MSRDFWYLKRDISYFLYHSFLDTEKEINEEINILQSILEVKYNNRMIKYNLIKELIKDLNEVSKMSKSNLSLK